MHVRCNPNNMLYNHAVSLQALHATHADVLTFPTSEISCPQVGVSQHSYYARPVCQNELTSQSESNNERQSVKFNICGHSCPGYRACTHVCAYKHAQAAQRLMPSCSVLLRHMPGKLTQVLVHHLLGPYYCCMALAQGLYSH